MDKLKTQRVTTKAVFIRNNSVLLLNYKSPKTGLMEWELPGGTIQFGETPEIALRRELREELGLQNPIIERLVHVFSFVVNWETEDRQYIALVYQCNDPDSQQLVISNEHLGYEWIPIVKLDQLNIKEGHKTAIKMARLSLSELRKLRV